MAEDNLENEEEWNPLRLREDEEMDFFTELALHEAERWIQAVTRKKFEYCEDFRKSLGNGVLLCQLLNSLKPGSVKRINKLPGAISGLDNVNVFLAACEKNFGLDGTQLFDPNDLEDLSNRAISDENEYYYKQEVDRRARNVAVTVYWLGLAVAGKYKGPAIDASAFAALVHSHGSKNIISDDCFKDGNPVTKANNTLTESSNHIHIRDSSYDSLGSYEHESESSFDELDSSGTMPVRSDMREIRRYGSASSLQMSRDLRLSTASGESAYSEDKHDSMYVSSPDLSQGSHAHTRSSSTDSMDGNYYGDHSRQSSGSTDNHSSRRISSSKMRKTSTSIPDPMQFVKMKSAADLAAQAKKQMEVTKEVNIMRGKVETPGATDEPDWQSNFSNWKSRRKSTHTRVDSDSLDEDMEKKPQKTFGQIVAEKVKRTTVESRSLYGVEIAEEKADKQDERHQRRSLGAMNFYPLDDDDNEIGVKSREPPLSKSSAQKNESKPKGKKTATAPWARDSSGEENSQSDSETNNSHQSGDTDSVFSDKSTPSKVLSDDDSWMKGKTNTPTVHSRPTPPVRTQRSLGGGMKLWESSANESQQKDDKRIKDLPTNSANIRNITQAFEQKDKDANAAPVVAKRPEFNRSPFSKSLDLTDHSYSRPYSTTEKKPASPLSSTSPKALVPRDQRYSSPARSPTSYIPAESPTSNNVNQKFTEKMIKINQKPNNDRGFGFYLVGGVEKRQPVTVQKVSLGSAADVCEVEANDELISVNSRDVTTLTLAQVQGIVDHSVKRGQIELRIKRYVQEDGYDSMEDNAFTDKPSVNNNNSGMDTQTDSSQSTDRSDDTGNYRPTLQMSMKMDDRPRLMDQLIGEQQREENNNEKNKKASSPESVETFTAAVKINTQSTPRQQTTPVKQTGVTNKDMSAPEDVMLTEERPTISVKRSAISAPTQADHSPVQMRRVRAPMPQNYPPDPTPPKAELPSVTMYTNNAGGATSTDDSSGSEFGPPTALLRWQRPRPKSEYENPFSSPAGNKLSERTKRYSSTLPYKSDTSFTFDKDYSKDDSMIDIVSKDFIDSVSVSKPVESKPNAYQFNDTSRIEDWQQKQDQHRLPEQHSSTPPIELNMHREQSLTAQSAAPARKHAQIDAPNLTQINKPDYNETPPLSPQEKFERDQQRIRLQYEEEKKLAREADKRKHEQEQQALNSDKFLRDMESQILQTKQEATKRNLDDTEPIRYVGTQPKFSSEPMTIRLPSSTAGRQLVIDPRNQGDTNEILPQYSFRVNLSNTESGPPLRTLEQHGSTEKLLAMEREKIREEEKHKFEEEQQRWKEEKERELRQQQESIEREREHLQREQMRIEKERAMLEQKTRHEDNFTSSYLPVNNHVMYTSPRSSTGSAGSSVSPRSPPPALDPKHQLQSRTAPPPTAPRPERGPTKGRLTREDLLAMNRKATPLVRPDTVESGDSLDNGLSPTTREAPSKGELHSLNAVPKQKFRSSAAWIKDEEIDNNSQNERPYVIGNRSDIIHQRDYSNPSDHWVVREAEKRRLAEQADYVNSEGRTAHAGPTKPSQSSLVSRFRGDLEPPPRSNRFSYPSSHSSDIRLSPTPRSGSSLRQYDRSPEQTITQFSARTRPNSFASSSSLSQTLPPNFSFNANVQNLDGVSAVKPVRSLTDDTGPVIAVSGKQKCSHCGEELGFGAAMVIESLGLYYHVQCFRCCVCHAALGNGSEGTDVRVRVNKLHCRNCYSNDEAGLKFSKV